MATATKESLLDRKLHLMERLACRSLFEQLEGLDAQIAALLATQDEAQQQVNAAKASVAEAEMLSGLAVEGKNETERKTQRALALKSDAAYQAALGTLARAEAQSASVATDLDVVKRQARRLEQRINYNVAVLEFLGE